MSYWYKVIILVKLYVFIRCFYVFIRKLCYYNFFFFRPVKLPRLSISKTPKILKEKKDVLKSPEKVSESNLIKNNKSKKEYIPQTAVKIPSITSATTSSVAAHRVPLESTSPRPTKQSSNVDLNCKVDSTNVDVEDGRCGPFYQFKTDGLTISNKKDLNSKK